MIFLGVVVALGCTLVAFLVDYLKGKNERLREQVLEMTVRQEERARLAQPQLDQAAVLTAIAQVGRNLEVVVRSAIHPESASDAPVASAPVFHSRPAPEQPTEAPVAQTPVEEPVESPVPALAPTLAAALLPLAPEAAGHALPQLATPDVPAPVELPSAAAQTSEPDWRQATWHGEVAEVASRPEDALPEDALPEAELPEAELPGPAQELAPVLEANPEPVVTTKPIREALRSLFDSPAALTKASELEASQREMERRLDEVLPESAPEETIAALAPEAVADPLADSDSDAPVVRIRVLNNNVATPLDPTESLVAAESAVPELLAPEMPAAPLAEAELEAELPAAAPEAEELPAPEAEELAEPLAVADPVDFLSPADLGETELPAPLESFDSLMAAVNAEPAIAPEPELETPAEAQPEAPAADPGVLVLPSGMNDRATLDFLKRDQALFTGLIVSIGINDYARLQETSGRPAAEELAKSVSQLVKSLITAPNGSEFFGCRASDDEFILVFADENGSVAQRRLNSLSERLWDFQLRSLGNFSVMFSWGATEVNGETFADSVEAASERMRETRHNRRTISMEKTRLKKVVNG